MKDFKIFGVQADSHFEISDEDLDNPIKELSNSMITKFILT
jgi:hypothetical protein